MSFSWLLSLGKITLPTLPQAFPWWYFHCILLLFINKMSFGRSGGLLFLSDIDLNYRQYNKGSCVDYLWLCDKLLPHLKQETFIISFLFCGSEIPMWLKWALWLMVSHKTAINLFITCSQLAHLTRARPHPLGRYNSAIAIDWRNEFHTTKVSLWDNSQ